MKDIYIFLLVVFFSENIYSQVPAFPGANGGGMYTTGGRGGQVYYVTSLEDDGSLGTLRWAINQTGVRTILFKVSGLITLKSPLKITNGNLTIAGQTAPGDGICLKNYEFYVGADNVIIRYLRFRLGNEIIGNESDAIWGRYQKNIIIDHCSMSWSIDECASFYSNENFTLQWCLIAESLNNAGHSKGAHGYGGLWGGKNASFHHNLIAHHNSRNPRFNGWKRSGLSYNNPLDEERLDFRNNVVYNWGDNTSYGGESAGKYNIVANYFKFGPGTKSTIKYKVTQVDIDASASLYPPGYGQYYINDNYIVGSNANTQNNWLGVTYASGVNTTTCNAAVPFQNTGIVQHTAEIAYERVLEFVGASLTRDTIDKRVVKETRNGTITYIGSVSGKNGIIDSQNDVGGWPNYISTTPPTDADNDGVPDGWLASYYPGKTANGVSENGYTYLELYINSLVETITQNQNNGGVVTGISIFKNDIEVQAIYSPSYKKLTLKTDKPFMRIRLTDLAGRVLKNISTSSMLITIDLSSLSSSVYLVNLYSDNSFFKTIKIAI